MHMFAPFLPPLRPPGLSPFVSTPTVKTVGYCLSSRWDLICAARTPSEVLAPRGQSVERMIAATDAEIDRLVYDLYGLTRDEVKIVEEAPK